MSKLEHREDNPLVPPPEQEFGDPEHGQEQNDKPTSYHSINSYVSSSDLSDNT